MNENIVLKTEHITKEYKSGKSGVFRALDDVNVEIERAKLTIIKGRSGSGKTTLLNMLSYLDKPTSGIVTMGETELGKLSDEEMEDFRREHMGFVFQSVALFPIMSAYENVDFALRSALTMYRETDSLGHQWQMTVILLLRKAVRILML